MMLGVEVAVGYALAFLVRKLRRAAGRVDEATDRLVDSATENLLAVVSRAVGDDDQLRRAAQVTEEGSEVEAARARERIVLAVAEAVQADPDLAAALDEALHRVQAAATQQGTVLADGEGIAAGGDIRVKAQGGSVAALRTGDVHLGHPPVPGAQRT